MKRILFCLLCLCLSTFSFAGNGYYTVTANGITSGAFEYTNWKSIVNSAHPGTSRDNMTIIDVYNVTFGGALGTENETVDPATNSTMFLDAWIMSLVTLTNCTAYTRYMFHNCTFNKDWIGFGPVNDPGVQLYFDYCTFNYRTPYGLNGYGIYNVDVCLSNCIINEGGYAGCCYGDCSYINCEFFNIDNEKVNVQCGYSDDPSGIKGRVNSFGEPSRFLMKDCKFSGDYPEDDVISVYTLDFCQNKVENVNIELEYYKAKGYQHELSYISKGTDFTYTPESGFPIFHAVIPGKIFITIPESGYTTYCTPGDKNIDISSQTANFKAYRATKFIDTEDYTHLYFSSTDKLNKDEGYLLRGIPGKYEVKKASDGTIYPQGNNGMKRGDNSVHPDCFVLANKSAGLGFYRLLETANVPIGKAYLDITDITESLTSAKIANLGFGSMHFDDQATTIENIQIKPENYKMYNIAGQQVNNNYHGCVIIKGKKYVTK